MCIQIKEFQFKHHVLEISTFLFVSINLAIVQLKVPRPMLLAERFVSGAGWLQILMVGIYAAYIAHKMKSPQQAPIWRLRIWILFSIVFFGQLILGLLGVPECLMTGKLHFPIPAMIVAGSVYRGEISFMVILFVITILLSGPAWCSQLCYFGAIDGIAARGKTARSPLKHVWRYKLIGIITTIAVALLLRLSNVPIVFALITASACGIGGLLIIFLVSRTQHRMVHCITYCPIGTIVSVAKFASPFRMSINTDCSQCMKCTSSCKYNALQPIDIKNLKPGLTCTYCGDCVQSCHSSSIRYKFFGFSASNAREIYLFITISLHAMTLVLARI